MNKNQKEYLTPAEAAERLYVHERTIARWIKNGALTVFRMGNTTRIPRKEFEDFVQKNTSKQNAA
jgi:excisionase family DNA binding protein